MAIYVCSDLHLGHDKEFLWKTRGFNSVEEHDAAIIQRHNELVKPDDTVYCLGDLFFGDKEQGIEKLQKLNGQFYVVIGNHDTNARVAEYLRLMGSDENNHFKILNVQYAYEFKYKKYHLFFTHYPTITGNPGSPFYTWNIHGHTHSNSSIDESRLLCYDVSPEAHDCRPILLDDILEELRERKTKYKELSPTERQG